MTRVKVDVGAETRVNVTLTLQATEAAVNVSAEAPLMQPDNSALSEVVNNKQVDALPINGRDFRRLTMLAAGRGAAFAARLARLVHRQRPARKGEHLSD